MLAANGVRADARHARRVHADPGRVARDPGPQPRPHARSGRRHPRDAVAQSAEGRWLQVQPAERRTGRPGHHALDRDRGEPSHRRRSSRVSGACRGRARSLRRPPIVTTTSTRTSANSAGSSTWNSSRAPACAWASIRSAAPASHYWAAIADRYGIDLTVVSDVVDATFRFMTLDRDGQIRMDPSSSYAMKRLSAIKDDFDVAFACDNGPRPPRHRDAERRAAATQPLSFGRHRLPVPQPARLVRRGRGRQDGGEHATDRPRGQAPRPSALRGSRRLQVVRRRASSTARSASAARRAPAPHSCDATVRCGRPTRTA